MDSIKTENLVQHKLQLPVPVSPLVQVGKQKANLDFLSFFQNAVEPAPKKQVVRPKSKPDPIQKETRPLKSPKKTEKPEARKTEPDHLETRDSEPVKEEPKSVDASSQDQEARSTRDEKKTTEQAVDESDASEDEAKQTSEASNEDAKAEETESSSESAEESEGQAASDQSENSTEENQQESGEEELSLEEVQFAQSQQVEELVQTVDLNLPVEEVEAVDVAELSVAQAEAVEETVEVAEIATDIPIEESQQEVEPGVLASTFADLESLQDDPELREKVVQLLDRVVQAIESGEVKIAEEFEGQESKIAEALKALQQVLAKEVESLQQVKDTPEFQKLVKHADQVIETSVKAFEGKIELDQGFEKVSEQESEQILKKLAGSEQTSEEGKELEIEPDAIKKIEIGKEETQTKKAEKPKEPSFVKEAPLDEAKLDDTPEVDPMKSDKTKEVPKKAMAVARLAMNIKDAVDQNQNQQQQAATDTNKGQIDLQSQGQKGSREQSQRQPGLPLAEILQTETRQAGKESTQNFQKTLKSAVQLESKAQMGPADLQSNNKKAQVAKTMKNPHFRRSAGVILTQITNEAKKIKMPTVNSIKMVLNPKHLGELQFEVKRMEDGLRIRFEAETHVVKEAIERNLSQLKDNLKEIGLDISKMDVDVKDQSEQGKEAENEDKNKQNKKNNKREFDLEEGENPQTPVGPEVIEDSIINHYA